MIDPAVVLREFEKLHRGTPRLFSAPGRLNLIGEHTDYNDGFVLPMAIERNTVVAAAPREGRRVHVTSLAHADAPAVFDLDAPGPKQRGHWLDYVEGVAQALEERGLRLRGADLVIGSDVPTGAGLSSSAALEISVGLALAAIAGRTIPAKELALAGQSAEHTYVGTRCGIMDQYIAALGEEGHALLVDCRTLEPALVPVDLDRARIVVCDTHTKHDLASSEYNTRRAECERGVALLRDRSPRGAEIRALRDVTVAELDGFEADLPEPVRRRCRHVVHENDRTVRAADALRRGDLATVGTLMYESHRSLRDDYEVSAPELDHVVDTARAIPGVYGARMTGGGFGGCAIALVSVDAVDAFTRDITHAFVARFRHAPTLFATRACAGAHEIVSG